MFDLSVAVVLLSLTWSYPQTSTPGRDVLERAADIASKPADQTALMSVLDLREPPPPDAYAITGNYLPPFLQAVVSAWHSEFPRIPLSANSIIFVIRPTEFYARPNPEEQTWLASREMLGLRNFPIIINPLTPGDDWYLTAQREWKAGNKDAIYVLLTSLFHEITHTQQGTDESAAYHEQLALFERFRKHGKLASPYALACRESLRTRYADLRKHPEQYVQVRLRFQSQAIALLVRAPASSALH
jgi:hypothetical protein